MKPVVEFCLALSLLVLGGCSAIAGIFTANIWAAIFAVGTIGGLIFILSYGSNKSKQ